MPKLETAECVVLKSSKYKDLDRIYTFFSPTYGKFSCLAKGVLKVNSKRLANLDTLNKVKVSFYESKSGINVLTQVELLKAFKHIKNSQKGIYQGLYMAELVHRFFYSSTYNHESSLQVYNLLNNSLDKLNKFYSKFKDKEYEFVSFRILNYFELNILKILGYDIDLDQFLVDKKLSFESINYLKSLKNGMVSSLDKLLVKDYKSADFLIKAHIESVLEESIISKRFLTG